MTMRGWPINVTPYCLSTSFSSWNCYVRFRLWKTQLLVKRTLWGKTLESRIFEYVFVYQTGKEKRKIRKTQTYNFYIEMLVASWCCTCFCVVLCVSFCTGHFVVVPLNLTYIHCLQHSFFEHLFNLYWK